MTRKGLIRRKTKQPTKQLTNLAIQIKTLMCEVEDMSLKF